MNYKNKNELISGEQQQISVEEMTEFLNPVKNIS